MSKALTTCLIWGLLLGVGFPATAKQASKTEGEPDLKITLLVYDCAGIQADLLSRALDQTKGIFGDAGVVVAPIICTQGESPAVCKQALDPLHIALRLVPKPVPGTDYDALGYAPGPYITVNYSGVAELADSSDVLLERILGCVVAHELGHVLLGPNAHSVAGVMTARLTDKELRLIRMMPLRFLPCQKERIRAYVLSHTRDLGAGSIMLAQR